MHACKGMLFSAGIVSDGQFINFRIYRLPQRMTSFDGHCSVNNYLISIANSSATRGSMWLIQYVPHKSKEAGEGKQSGKKWTGMKGRWMVRSQLTQQLYGGNDRRRSRASRWENGRHETRWHTDLRHSCFLSPSVDP